MAKTVYSLVLTEEVVAAVDALAAREGYSRSALINHILAQHLSLPSAEGARRQTIEAAQKAVAGDFRNHITAGGALALRTALPYKYNPSLSYIFQLEGGGSRFGQLRVALRSQNDGLLAFLGLFWDEWQQLEAAHLPTPPTAGEHTVTPKGYRRTLRRPQGGDEAANGRAVAAYIALLDASMKAFFRFVEEPTRAAHEAEKTYLSGLKHVDGILEL